MAGVNRPQEPDEDRRAPVDPWATIDRPVPTVYLGNPDRTAAGSAGPAGSAGSVDSVDETAYLAGPSAAGETVHFAGPPAVGETVHLPGPPTVGETVYLGGSAAARETVHLSGPSAAGETVHLAGAPVPTRLAGGTDSSAFAGGTDSTVRVAAEMRFGPGVPAAPAPAVAAPGWPARQSRPVWRRVVSLLSSMLTLALVAVAGFYLWQRLQPIEVQSVTVAVPKPPGNQCDITVDVIATVRTNGRGGAIRYQWFRSGVPGGILTEQVSRGQRSATLTLRWTFSGVGATTETATVNLIDPSAIQASTPITYSCRRD